MLIIGFIFRKFFICSLLCISGSCGEFSLKKVFFFLQKDLACYVNVADRFVRC